ncbi:unnamed protein product [Strongylus vulgaris]|uniref:Uncharacterized protein n=1 Tax=Strongylus vulgaris TaxID=40348 RepID=A0A3P7IZR0_STRVU|nr:unnamed protein product [Strongylus vulgaris]
MVGSGRDDASDGRTCGSKDALTDATRPNKDAPEGHQNPELFAYAEAPTQQISVIDGNSPPQDE